MRIIDLIDKKAKGHELTKQEINFIITNYVNKNIPDYQMSSLLMAIRLKSMSDQEIAHLTEAMMNSGKVLNWDFLNTIVVDKHSTGGVGDKVSIVLAPLLASLGLTIIKMSGRGLGHTGGTIDKLETIKGFKISLTEQECIDIVKKHNLVLMGQDEQLVPADKLIYALRDVTATVQSVPLIASSIMSKKLATGSNVILLDVKCGSGAFMKNIEEATKLANQMVNIGKNLGRKVLVEITNMQQPLGRAIGNKNEILEAIETLKGNGPKQFQELIYSSASTLLLETNKAKTLFEAKKLIDQAINSGNAFLKFKDWIQAQGGNVEEIFSQSWFAPKYKKEIIAHKSGYLEILSSLEFGIAAMKLGAGRQTKEDKIDNEAGIYLNKLTNEQVKIGDILFTLYSSNPIDENIINDLNDFWKINDIQIECPIILKKIQ
ncbi:thymidine phosphorylase [Mycoplasma miroungirhinis]|uniref:Thymidine phosphorylase n=1 Tax=Mycoplasma miroungirhinis TaxID=754516 RepID=A0A6M4JDA8_9MOLU|nr:thymidine phosphorylase [Mycoplasma miroungirhinis]QJR44067.1 thymidine phosphorylase [Mycoplasma miroungirhinis]